MPFDSTDFPVLMEQHLPQEFINESEQENKEKKEEGQGCTEKEQKTWSVAPNSECCTDHKVAQLGCPEGQAGIPASQLPQVQLSAGSSSGLSRGINERRYSGMNVPLLLSLFIFSSCFFPQVGTAVQGFVNYGFNHIFKMMNSGLLRIFSVIFIPQVLFHFLLI